MVSGARPISTMLSMCCCKPIYRSRPVASLPTNIFFQPPSSRSVAAPWFETPPDMIRLLLFLALPALVSAQTRDTTARTAADSVIQRARKLGMEGREGDGRRLIDSLLKVATPDSAIYAEALYARASLATTAVDAERDYRRLLIEVPLSPRAEDALLQLAQLLQARGDRRGASDHLQRFMLTYANSPARPRVALSLVRLLFEQGPQQQARACEALRMGREAIPKENFELRNQLDYYEPRCIGELGPAVAPETTAVAVDSTKAPV